jgi:glycerophosphoryl diester phosphodiesterase
MLNKLPRPTIFAHRGSSSYAPENTISAFNLAVQQGAHAIELDVMLSADKKVVVIHDQSVDRTTDGSGQVRKMDLIDLLALDAGSYYDTRFQGERIPTLEDVFSKLNGKIFFNIELKNLVNPIDQLPRITAELVKNYGLEDSVLFSSFNPIALIKINNYLPECDIGLLVGGSFFDVIMNSSFNKYIPHQALHSNVLSTTTELVKSVHDNGRRIHVYTVDDGITMKKLLAMGVDGFFTNDPLLARKMIDSA